MFNKEVTLSNVNARNDKRRLENKLKYEGFRVETATGICEALMNYQTEITD